MSGDFESRLDSPNSSAIGTSGGAFVEGSVVAGGDFVGRDKIVNNIQNIYQCALTAAERARQAQSIEAEYLAQGVSALAQRLRARASETADASGPYKGLLEYRLGDAEIFFGRDRDISRVLQCLERGPLTILHSESGAGKTSLLQAGVSPRLIASGHLPVYGRPYNAAPALAVKQVFLSNLSLAPGLAAAPLRDFLRQVCGILDPRTTLHILLDQFEEFFVHLQEQTRAEFVRELAECLDDESLNVRWMLALRTEFFGHLADFRPRIRNPFDNDHCLKRLARDEAQDVIARPARRFGIQFEDDLVDTLLNDLGKTEIAPPQLQLVCSALYNALEDDKKVTRELYVREGSAAGILGGYLERVLTRDLPPPQRAPARQLLESLISSSAKRILRTRAELAAELALRGMTGETLDAILDQLVASRLLRVQESDRDGELAYELVHDYLLDEIKLDPAVQARKATQELLDREVESYRQHRTLLSDDKLAIIQPRKGELVLSDEARALLRKSEQAFRRRRGLIFSSIGVVLVLIALAVSSAIATVESVRTRNVVLTREAIANASLQRAFEQTSIIPVGIGPTALTFDGKQVWVANRDENTVQTIDPATGKAGAPIQVGRRPAALAFDGKRVWVANYDGRTVQAVDPSAGKVSAPIPVGDRPSALALDTPHARLWVANSGDNTVQAIDLATGKTGVTITVGSYPSALTLDGMRLWVANANDDTVQAIDLATNRVNAPIQVDDYPVALVFDGKRLWVANRDNYSVRAIDPSTGKMGLTVYVGSNPFALAFDGKQVWVANYYGGTLQAIDPVTEKASKPIPVGSSPAALVFDGMRIWVADYRDRTVQALDPAAGNVSEPIEVGLTPFALTFDGTRVWVACQREGTVRALNLSTEEIEPPIVVGQDPSALAFDGKRVWVANAGDEIVQAIDPSTGKKDAPVQVGNRPSALTFDGKQVWVVNSHDSTVQAIDPLTGKAGAPIRVDTQPIALAFDGKRVWVASLFNNTVQAIDPSTGKKDAPVQVGRLPYALAFEASRAQLWVANQNDHTVQAIDVTTGVASAPIPVAHNPSALAFDGKRLWVAVAGANAVQAIDPATGYTGVPIRVGSRPLALTFDGERLWVANSQSHTLQYITIRK